LKGISGMALLRALLLAAVTSVALVGSLPASAAEWKPFDASAFAAAQKEGKPILVDVFAVWCPVCRAQNPILTQLTREPKYKDLVVFKVDFDTQKADVRALKATQQSTLIAYKGEKETGRTVGDTNPQSIAALVDSAL
jgi:thioredoxin 1